MKFGDRLKSARENKGFTQQYIADLMGIDKSTYCGYEIGKRMPDVEKTKALASILDVSTDFLIGVLDEEKPAANNDELKPVYLSLAKNMQAEGIHPDDIRDMIEILKRRRNDKG